MSFAGTMLVLLGLFILDSVVKNRAPVQTLKQILQNPKAAKTAVENAPAAWTPSQSIPPPRAGETTASLITDPNSNAADVATVLTFARAQIGKPYVWGAEGPNAYDCSGLVQAAFSQVGIRLPRVTYGQVLMGKGVSKADVQPGDIVFPDPGHVQIWSGNGNVIEAANPREGIREVREWSNSFVARRIIGYVKPSRQA